MSGKPTSQKSSFGACVQRTSLGISFVKMCGLILRDGKIPALGFPGGAVVKNPPANAGDTGASPGPERSHMLQSN